MEDLNVRPDDLKTWMENGEDLQLVDVREDPEIALAEFPGALHIPMNKIPERVGRLDPDRKIITICHHGMRSLSVAQFLKEQAGFENVLSLQGGIDEWAMRFDTSIPRY